METELQSCLNLVNAELISFTQAGEFTGYSGVVYFANVKMLGLNRKLVVKFTPVERETDVNSLNYTERVYQVRVSNFGPSYKLLTNSGIKIPEIYYEGQKEVRGNIYWLHIMEKLEGVSLRHELEKGTEREIADLHRVTGEIMGALHKIVRAYDGWPEQNKESSSQWFDDFLKLLNDKLEKISLYNKDISINKNKIQIFIEQKKAFYSKTYNFVFCHLGGGLQGLAKEFDRKWVFTGLIDIEDLYFTDQAFSLAGLELSLNYNGRKVLKEFWSAYSKLKEVPDNYDKIKGLYELFYVLEWLTIPYEDFDPEEMESKATIKKSVEYILNLVG